MPPYTATSILWMILGYIQHFKLTEGLAVQIVCVGFGAVYPFQASTALGSTVKQAAFQYVFLCTAITETQPLAFLTVAGIPYRDIISDHSQLPEALIFQIFNLVHLRLRPFQGNGLS